MGEPEPTPCHSRLHAPGTLQHVIVRDESDREAFVTRLGELTQATGTDFPCLR